MATLPLSLVLAALAWPRACDGGDPTSLLQAAPSAAAGAAAPPLAALQADLALQGGVAAALLSELRQMRAELEQSRREAERARMELNQTRRDVEALRAQVQQRNECSYFEKQGDTLVLNEMNLRVVSASRTSGLGNLIVGRRHDWSASTNGVAVGFANTLAGSDNFVAGYLNTAQDNAKQSSILGGQQNKVTDAIGVVLGGTQSTAGFGVIRPASCGC